MSEWPLKRKKISSKFRPSLNIHSFVYSLILPKNMKQNTIKESARKVYSKQIPIRITLQF